MHFLEAEGGWSLSFAGSGFLGLYHVGATQCLHQRAPRILQGARCFYGSSAGALNAMTIVCGMSTGAWGRSRGPGTPQGAESSDMPSPNPRALHPASESEDCGHFYLERWGPGFRFKILSLRSLISRTGDFMF